AARDGVSESHRGGERERSRAFDPLLERRAGDVLHDDERKAVDLTDVVDADDVRVGELGEGPRFLHEELAQGAVGRGVRVEDLDRDLAAERGVLSEVDLRGAACADRLEDPIALIEDAIHCQLRTAPRSVDAGAAYDSS